MNFKAILISLIMALPLFSYAQDKIYKRNGEVVEAKIKSIGTKTITYLRYDNQSGPEYTIVKVEVDKIVYQNGSVDVIESRRAMRPSFHHGGSTTTETQPVDRVRYSPNVLALAPIQLSENGLGVGLSYERALDKNGIVAFYMPAILTWNLNNSYYDYNTNTTKNGNADMMMYAMPGVKIYPTGSYGVIRYAIGTSLVIGGGQKSNANNIFLYDPATGASTSTTTYITQQHLVLGIMVNNSMNINPTPHIYLGLELGLGFTYLNRIGSINQDTEFLAQFGFKVGYRF